MKDNCTPLSTLLQTSLPCGYSVLTNGQLSVLASSVVFVAHLHTNPTIRSLVKCRMSLSPTIVVPESAVLIADWLVPAESFKLMNTFLINSF